ncbi:MAG: methylated-DNA--[protein]-cysteine S-methyltransferase [Nitrolancea sp.]
MKENGREPEHICVGCYVSPLGDVWIAASDQGVRVMTVPASTREDCLREVERTASGEISLDEGGRVVERAIAELRAYFAGELRQFSVPLDLRGTPFQQRVWRAVFDVPCGEVTTYREIALRIDAPNAYRAVGAANGANPAAIIVPCHRIVGSDGKLHGYGGGLHQKRALLDMEAGRQTFQNAEVSPSRSKISFSS